MDFDDTDFAFDDSCLRIDFSSWKRCRVLSKIDNFLCKYVKLHLALDDTITGDILLDFPWNQLNINEGNIVSVFGKYNEDLQLYVITNDFGLLIVNPDYLISSTKVSQSLFCQRKAVLSEKFLIETTGNLNMIVGVLVHEIFQKVLLSILSKKVQPNVAQMCADILKSREVAFKCYESLLGLHTVEEKLLEFTKNIESFLKNKIVNPLQKHKISDAVSNNLKIDKIEDIEENIWSSQLGLKGKIDVTVHLHGRKPKNLSPFELKTGKASMEHRAQIILYVTMMKQMNFDVDSGLLYYLKDDIMSEVNDTRNEVRDLIIARNELVNFLTSYETEKAHLKNSNSEYFKLMKLPLPLTRESICNRCEYSFVCALFHTNAASSNPNVAIQSIGERILKHLSNEDLAFFLKWTDILMKEEESLSEGQYIILSTMQRVAVTTGILSYCNEDAIQISFERNLLIHYPNEKFIIDQYTSRNYLNFSLGNVVLLMQNTPLANNLRNIIVQKIPTEYQDNFSPSIPNSVFLNEAQCKTVQNALNCKNYVVIKGYAGTGKTETIVAIVNSYYKQKKSVLITSHTHSAVDNILLRLRTLGLKFLRVGNVSRLKSEIQEFSDCVVTKNCQSPSEFESVYAQYTIIGSTCYGVTHPLFSRRVFDVCIVDEATQVTQPVIIRSLLCAKKFILVGDPYQLPPVIKSNLAKSLGGDESLFCYLESLGESQELRMQYRMNRPIASLANSFTYNKKLMIPLNQRDENIKNDEVVEFDWETRVFSLSIKNATLFINTGNVFERNIHMMSSEIFSVYVTKITKIGHNLESPNKLYLNIVEAVLVVHLVLKFINCGIRSHDIGVIASYRSQVDFLKCITKNQENLKNLEINTVDQYQGRDKEFIIYSCTKTKRNVQDNIQTNKLSNEILDDYRRLNVAITRAKRKLILIGDYTSIKENLPFQKLLDCMDNNIVCIPESFYEKDWKTLLYKLPLMLN
ncbi:DNA replication ATP-dependent helicase/nuclease DNA2 isoform X2 [Culicoides brevitarsis]|uniref:DNA replication ATP-dependent helicase/nuclease DNA2 isoform X2 n=1 Tax=Culicoides brevitarsis TaxID=469753 RepID=UPI00307BD95C